MKIWFGLSVAAAVMLTAPAMAQDVPGQTRISLAEGEVFAQQALRSGQPQVALDIATALLQADPDDASVLTILAQAQLRLGNIDEAKTAARAAWRAGVTERERFIAAVTMADILAADEAYTRSQIWLRRAIQTAPGPQSEAVAINAFRRVRQENPLAIEMRFGLVPSDNVNAGNSNETISFAYLPDGLSEIQFPVPADQRPLSGIEISAQTDLRYRISQTDTSRTSLEFGVYGRTYVMSDSAKASAPDVTGESLSYMQASLGLLHQWVANDTPFSANLNYSHAWAGGQPYTQDLSASLGAILSFQNDDQLALSAGLRYSDFINNPTSVTTYTLRTAWSRQLENQDVFGVNGQLAYATSNDANRAYSGATLGVSYDFGDVLEGVDLAARWSEEWREYETSLFDPAGREDRISTIGIDLGLQNVDLYGFLPVVSVQGRRTDSSIPRLDTEGVQMGLSLRSSF